MKVFRPSQNDLKRGYTTSHKGYDFSGVKDTEENFSNGVFACEDGEIIQSVNLYVNSWTNTGTLTTRDYGNYIKCRHTDGSFSLYAHLQKDSPLSVGTKVKKGQRIATIGNTGNSTGPHLHFEYRNSSNINGKVDFDTEAATTYKGLDLTNLESMKVAVDSWYDLTQTQKYMTREEHAQQINATIATKNEECQQRIDKIKVEAPTPSEPEKPNTQIVEITTPIKLENVSWLDFLRAKIKKYSEIIKSLRR